jgi:hypothetical protein
MQARHLPGAFSILLIENERPPVILGILDDRILFFKVLS